MPRNWRREAVKVRGVAVAVVVACGVEKCEREEMGDVIDEDAYIEFK